MDRLLTSYQHETILVFGEDAIISSTRFYQGDPLAPLLFALVLQPVIERIQQEVLNLKVNGWLLYDGVNVGTKDELRQVVDILQIHGPPTRGLYLSTSVNVGAPVHSWVSQQYRGQGGSSFLSLKGQKKWNSPSWLPHRRSRLHKKDNQTENLKKTGYYSQTFSPP